MGNDQKKMMAAKGYISAGEAAKRIGKTTSNIYKLIEDGKLIGIDIGVGSYARHYVLVASLVSYIGPDAAKLFGLTAK